MAIEYVGSNRASTAGSTTIGGTVSLTELTGGIDTTARTGDIVIACVSVGATSDISVGITTADYSNICELYINDTYDCNLSVNYKIMGATPDTSVVSAPSGNAAWAEVVWAYVFRGVDTTTPLDVTRTTAVSNTDGVPTPPAITPTTAGAIILCIGAGAGDDELQQYTTATLSGFVCRTSTDTIDSIMGLGYYAWSSGAYTPAKFGGGTNGSGYSSAACSLALRPVTLNTTNFFQFF